MVEDPAVTEIRRRLTRAEDRIAWLDEHGSRAVGGLTIQVTNLGIDVGEVKKQVTTAVQEIRANSGFRWTQFLTIIGFMIPFYGLVATLIIRGGLW